MGWIDTVLKVCIASMFVSTFCVHFYLHQQLHHSTMFALNDTTRVRAFRQMYGNYPSGELWSFGHFAHKNVRFAKGDWRTAFPTFVGSSHEKMLLVQIPFRTASIGTPKAGAVIEYKRGNKTMATMWTQDVAEQYIDQNTDWRTWCHIENIPIETTYI